MTAYTFRPAVREQTSLLIGLAGPSSSGKTYSALRLATGMANGGKIMMIDTEGRRGLHYADQFKFDHCDLVAPFRPGSYLEALEAAKKAGAAVIIVDSQSHEHEGPGGILEWHEEELQRMAGDDWNKRERVKFTAWIKPKREHNTFVNAVLQLGVHVIFCFRAKKKLELAKDPKTGKTVPVDKGWQPICSDRFEYEMTSLLMLPPNSQGVPDLAHESTKVQEQHKGIIKPGEQINEQMGKAFADWASGGTKINKKAPPKEEPVDALTAARIVARRGKDAFTAWWNGEGKPYRAELKPNLEELQKLCAEADAPQAEEDPFGLDGGGEETSSDGNGAEQVDMLGANEGELEGLIGKFGGQSNLEGLETMWAENNELINACTEDQYKRINDAYEARRQELRT